MAKETSTTSGDKAPRAPRRPRQSAASAAVDQVQDSGAQAPVSSSGEPAAVAENAAPPADQVDTVAPVVEQPERPPSFGMGRFPDDWQPAQTDEVQSADQAVQSLLMGWPEITEFPADLTLVNNTRNTLVLRGVGVRLRRFGEAQVQLQDAEQYQGMAQEVQVRALRERWDSDTGLQVKYGEDRE